MTARDLNDAQANWTAGKFNTRHRFACAVTTFFDPRDTTYNPALPARNPLLDGITVLSPAGTAAVQRLCRIA